MQELIPDFIWVLLQVGFKIHIFWQARKSRPVGVRNYGKVENDPIICVTCPHYAVPSQSWGVNNQGDQGSISAPNPSSSHLLVVSNGWYLTKHLQIGSLFNLTNLFNQTYKLGEFWGVLILLNTPTKHVQIGSMSNLIHCLAITDHSDFFNRCLSVNLNKF